MARLISSCCEAGIAHAVVTVADGAAFSRVVRRSSEIFLLGVVPCFWLAILLISWFANERAGFDLRHAFLPAADDVLHGRSPYPLPTDPEVLGRHAYVYTPLVAYATVPLTLLSTAAAVDLGMVASFACVVAILWLVGVRDWRCYTIALVWPPVVNSAGNVAVSLPLALLLAGAWRVRTAEKASGALVGCAVAAKTFAWPLLAWPLVMRRWGSAVSAVGVTLVLSLGTWALIGFAGLRDYPDLVRAVTDAQEDDSYSLSSALLAAGVDGTLARAALVVLTAALLWAAVVFGRRGAEDKAFVALLLAALATTPLLWQHYLVLLLLALGITRPRLSVVWLLPLVLYLAPMTGNGKVWQTLLVPAVTVIVGASCFVPWRQPGSARAVSQDPVPAGS